MSGEVIRQCVACGLAIGRKNLIRILFDHQDQSPIICPTKHQFGRSIYLCKNENCLSKLKKHKKFKNKLDFTKLKDVINKSQ